MPVFESQATLPYAVDRVFFSFPNQDCHPSCSLTHSHLHPFVTPSLVVGGAGLGELEGDSTAGELAVDLRVGVEAVVDAATLLLVEDDLEELAAVLLGAEALADDVDGVDKVGQDGVVDGSEGPRARALLLESVARAGGALGAGEDAARGQEDDVAVRELLLELAGQAVGFVSFLGVRQRSRGGPYRCWTRWKPWRDGTGTKTAIAFLPWPTSI